MFGRECKQTLATRGAASLNDEMTMANSRGLGSRRCGNAGFEVFDVMRAVVGGI